MAFPLFPKSSWSFCAGTYRSHFWRVAHAQKIEICRCTLGSAQRVCERHKQKKVSLKFPKESIASAKLQAKFFGITAPFVKMFRVQGKAWPSLLIAHLHNRLQRKGDVSKHLGKHTMRSGLSSSLMRKVTFVWTLKFAGLLWYDWTGGQSNMIGKQHSQLHRISKGSAPCIALRFSRKMW